MFCGAIFPFTASHVLKACSKYNPNEGGTLGPAFTALLEVYYVDAKFRRSTHQLLVEQIIFQLDKRTASYVETVKAISSSIDSLHTKTLKLWERLKRRNLTLEKCSSAVKSAKTDHVWDF